MLIFKNVQVPKGVCTFYIAITGSYISHPSIPVTTTRK